MLIEFSVKNFKTFKELNTISLVASNYDKNRLEENTISNKKGNLKLLKSAVLYGANASGKSKFFEAYAFFRGLIINSSKDSQADEEIGVTPFLLDSKSEKEPTSFEIILSIKGVQYRYEYETNKVRILREWLFVKENGKESEFFYRQKDKFSNFDKIEIADNLIARNMIRPNALFISVLAQFNDKTAKKLIGALRNINIISGLKHEGYEGFTVQEMENGKNVQKDEILQFLNIADFGIEDLKIDRMDINHLPDEMPDSLKEFIRRNKGDLKIYSDITSFRRKYNNGELTSEVTGFSMDDDESSGTRKYFALSGPILDTLKTGTTLFVDELDSQLHPILVHHLIKLFNSRENAKNAQLILNTHDVNLLNADVLRRDQIWFCEKDSKGAAHIYSLSDIKTENSQKIRNDENYEKNYLLGKYGAIPYIDKMEILK